MSHFTTGVIFQPTPGRSVEEQIERALAPYDENRLMPPYDQPCHCIGHQARAAARALAVERRGTIEQLRAQATEMRAAKTEAEVDAWWAAEIEVRDALEERWARLHPARTEPDPTCGFYSVDHENEALRGQRYEDGSGCGGSGVERSRANPIGFWDWWEIGGRWDGNLYRAGKTAENVNVRPISELLAQEPLYQPFALVLPTGEWVAKARMGWWACTSDELPTAWWAAEVRRLYEAHADCLLCLVDAHC